MASIMTYDSYIAQKRGGRNSRQFARNNVDTSQNIGESKMAEMIGQARTSNHKYTKRLARQVMDSIAYRSGKIKVRAQLHKGGIGNEKGADPAPHYTVRLTSRDARDRMTMHIYIMKGGKKGKYINKISLGLETEKK